MNLLEKGNQKYGKRRRSKRVLNHQFIMIQMLLRLTEKYDLSSNKIYNTVLREYIPEESLWRGGI